MKILVLSPYVPYPVLNGGRNRVLGLIRCLARFARLHVLAAGDPNAEDSRLSRHRLAASGIPLEVFQPTGPGADELRADDRARLPDATAHFRCPDLRARLPGLLDEFQPDAVQLLETVMAQYLDALPRPVLLDRQKIESEVLDAIAAGGADESAGLRHEAARFRGWEERLAGRVDRVLALGGGDGRSLGHVHGHTRVREIPIGVADGLRRPPLRTRDVGYVLLYGALDYAPNVEANAFYFREVWPRLQARAEGLRTIVVGAGAVPAELPASDPRVEVLGFVPDVGPLLRGPGVLVAPLRVGGGARTKVLEALACGMPVISSLAGAENAGLEPGVHYLRAETPAEIEAAVLRLQREPALAQDLSESGARHIDARFRWDGIGDRLEAVYRELLGSAPACRRVLLVGVRPGPDEPDARASGFPGLRTAQFRAALAGSGAELREVLLDEEPELRPRPGTDAVMLRAEDFRAGRALQAVHDSFHPHVVVAAGGYHASRVVARLASVAPRFIDLPGDLTAEAQLRAEREGDVRTRDAVGVLRAALRIGDAFSVVSAPQRLALLGQLGVLGRLPGATAGVDPSHVIPIGCPGPEACPELPGGPLRLLWAGSYNTWMDGDTLVEGLERAFAAEPGLELVATGGPVADHDEESHPRFWERIRRSTIATRAHDLGRLPRREATATLASCHVLLAISRPCLEAELGSRARVVEGAAYGRPCILTDLGDVASRICAAGAGIAVAAARPEALAAAILAFARDRQALRAASAAAHALWRREWSPGPATASLRAWIEKPSRWPASVVNDEDAAEPDAERFRLQSELDVFRASRTFRALRLFDRLVGRS